GHGGPRKEGRPPPRLEAAFLNRPSSPECPPVVVVWHAEMPRAVWTSGLPGRGTSVRPSATVDRESFPEHRKQSSGKVSDLFQHYTCGVLHVNASLSSRRLSRSSQQCPRRPRLRPVVETLEDRTVPSTLPGSTFEIDGNLIVDGGAGAEDWANAPQLPTATDLPTG